MIKRAFLILTMSSLLSACGFHLRGKYEYAPQLNPIAIVSQDRDFTYELKDTFDFSGLDVVDSQAANAILEFTSQEYLRDPVSLDARGRATRYNLKYTARYQLVNQAGDILLKNGRATASRILEYNASQVLQADSEERLLKEEIYQDLAQSIARRLARVTGEVMAEEEADLIDTQTGTEVIKSEVIQASE